MNKDILNQLYEPFKVEKKPGQGFSYVRSRYIYDRLNKVFDGKWGVSIKTQEVINNEVLVSVAVNIYDDEGRILLTQEGFGSAKIFKSLEIGNIFKSAMSRAVKSAVRNWGVALFLDDSPEDGEIVGVADSVDKMSSIPDKHPLDKPNVPNVPNVPKQPSTSFPEPPKTTEGRAPFEAPNVSKSSEQISSPNLPPVGAVPGGDNVKDVGLTSITPVQKVAISSKLASKGLEFDAVIVDFCKSIGSEDVPSSIDAVSYNNAIKLVNFLNSK